MKKNKIINWIKENKLVLIYVVFAILLEMVAVYAVEKNPIIKRPFIFLGLVFFIAGILLLIRKNVIRFAVCSIILGIQAIADLALVVVYDMTGQYFDFGMLSLRNDAWGILESIPMNFIAFYAAMFFCIVFVIYGLRVVRRYKTVQINRLQRFVYIIICVLAIGTIALTTSLNNSKKVNQYDKMLKDTQGSNYSSMGIIGNFVNEMSKGLVFTETECLDSQEIDNFLYSNVAQNSTNFGVSKDNNVIMILVESFEWFSFIQSEEYPNGLELSDEDIEFLFPNLTKFYDESVVVNNFHSKEKTDISETISILGSYPTGAYVDYDYETNTTPQTLPNVLNILSGNNIQCRSFHDGYKSFYNREKTHKMFGFESLTDSYDMYDISDKLIEAGKVKEATMHDYLSEGERNLDSEMINTCKNLMFPTDKRFFTYITTITMHGIYYERDNLSDYMDKLLSVYTPKNKNDDNESNLMNYVTTVMEFDHALGVMMDDLDEKGLLDNTTILMFGDHNSYYQQLSNYVKDIEDYDTDRYYTDLYKVPLMIYDKNLKHQVVDKFTCTSDIVPTMFDLLGVKTYDNMYYGTSIFNDKESVLYSRAYGFFAGDGIVCRSLNNILYLSGDVSTEYHEQFNQEATKLVDKIKYCDQIFYQDYFSKDKNMEKYVEKLKEIQD